MAIGDIENQTGVDRSQLYRLLNRCAQTHDDGRVFGYRALVRYSRVAQYERVAHLRVFPLGGSRRATNPDNFNANGTAKKGAKQWARSTRYKKRQVQLSEVERCLTAGRKRDHGELVNKILGLGNCIQTEKLSYKGWQKNFGRSAKVRAAGMFVSLIIRKAASAGGQVVELNTRQLKMSQYDHPTGVCTKKPLSQRWHELGGSNLLVQRDCYSAFLAKNVEANQHKPSQLANSWATAEPLLRRAGLCFNQSESGLRVPAQRTEAVSFK